MNADALDRIERLEAVVTRFQDTLEPVAATRQQRLDGLLAREALGPVR